MGSSFILAENEWKELLREWQSVPRSPNLNEAHSHPEGGNAGRCWSDGTSVSSHTGSTRTFPPLSHSSLLATISHLHTFLSSTPLLSLLPIFSSSAYLHSSLHTSFSLPVLPHSHLLFHSMNVSLLVSRLFHPFRFLYICSSPLFSSLFLCSPKRF